MIDDANEQTLAKALDFQCAGSVIDDANEQNLITQVDVNVCSDDSQRYAVDRGACVPSEHVSHSPRECLLRPLVSQQYSSVSTCNDRDACVPSEQVSHDLRDCLMRPLVSQQFSTVSDHNNLPYQHKQKHYIVWIINDPSHALSSAFTGIQFTLRCFTSRSFHAVGKSRRILRMLSECPPDILFARLATLKESSERDGLKVMWNMLHVCREMLARNKLSLIHI